MGRVEQRYLSRDLTHNLPHRIVIIAVLPGGVALPARTLNIFTYSIVDSNL